MIEGVPPGCGGGGGGLGSPCWGGGRDMMFDSSVGYRVNGAKSVETASSLALKARQSAGRN